MNVKMLFVSMLLSVSATCGAQSQDPVLMTVNGVPVTRSEFEYSYNKNNSEGVIDKKTVSEYVDLFINYKLKVAAALDARLDTLSSFKKEFATYRDQQVKPTLVTSQDIEDEARTVYENTKKGIGERGLIRPAHILLRLDQKATPQEQESAKHRIDSIYAAIVKGADFAEMAKKYSNDIGSARQGGLLPWIQPNQTVKEFENQAYALKKGQMSKPFLSPFGYHIILMKDRKQLEPYDSLRSNIVKFLEQRNVRERIASRKLSSMVKASDGSLTEEQVMASRCDSLCRTDAAMNNLIREYHDGLLMFEISNRMVWEKASKDEAALEAFFKKNKKRYVWTEPRFKGIAYHVKKESDVEAVKECVKKLKFGQWADALRTTFNNDSVLRIRVEKGIFKQGDNALVDREVFKKDTVVTSLKGFPFDAVYGKILKKGPEDYTDVRGLVTSDYQEKLEKAWVTDLRKKYAVKVDEEVLKTVNHHK